MAYITWHATYNKILSPPQMRYMLVKMYARKTIMQQMRSGHHYFLLKHQKSLVGFIDVSLLDEQSIKLHKLYLLPEYQGLGYGRRLIDFVKRFALHMGANSILLNVNRYNEALGFYKKNGFTIVASEDIDIGNNFFMNDYVMRLCL